MERLPDPVSADELLVHFDWVRRLARNLVRDPELAEDVAQETWVSALEKPARERSNLRGWLARIAQNAARQHGRSQKSREHRERRSERIEATPSTGELVELASLQRALVGHVLDLEEPYRSTILLHYFRELSVAKIAERERVSIDAVRSRITRGLEKLRTKLDRSSGGRETWLGAFTALLAPKSASLLLPAAAALLLVVAAGALWLALLRERSAPAVLIASTSGVDAPVNELASVSSPDALAERVALAPDADQATASHAGFELRFVDAATRAPIPELAFVVVDEKQGPTPVASGKTDADGRALLRDLPEIELVVESVRLPPHAPAVRAFDSRAGGTLEIPVGPGGTIRGRVVDDLGAPRTDAVVFQPSGPRPMSTVWQGYPDERTIVARADRDGRFEVAHLHSRPRRISIVDGSDHAADWEKVALGISGERWLAVGGERRDAHVEEGQVVDLGDVVLPRDRRVTGRVRYADGAPAVGARVSFARAPRSKPSGAAAPTAVSGGEASPAASATRTVDVLPSLARSADSAAGAATDELEPLPGEARTGSDGRFDLTLPSSGLGRGDQATVTTPNGYRQTAKLRLPAAGEVAETDEIVLRHRAPLEIAVGCATASGEEPPKDLTVRGIARVGSSTQETREDTYDVPDSLVRFSNYQDPSELRALEVSSGGWMTARIELPSGTVEGARFEVTLTRKPRIRVAVRWKTESGTLPASRSTALELGACVVSPPERSAAGADFSTCCGLGGFAAVPAGNSKACAIVVATRRPYWIRVRGWGDTLPEQSFGPWEPSEEVHTIVLDPGEIRRKETAPTPKAIPPKTTPSEPWLRTGIVRARILGRDGLPVHGSLFLRRDSAGEEGVQSGSGQYAPDGTTIVVTEAGRCTVRAQAAGHRPRDLGSIEVVVGETIDLGTIALEPMPSFRARIVEADGTPATRLRASVGTSSAQTDAQGNVELAGELPESFTLLVRKDNWSTPNVPQREQSVRVEHWQPGAPVELALQPWVELVVELEGLAPELADAEVWVEVVPLDAPAIVRPVTSSRIEMRAIRPADASESKHFRILLGPGRYRLLVHSLVVTADPIEVELDAETPQQTVRIPVR